MPLARLEDKFGGGMSFELQTEEMPGHLAATFISSGELIDSSVAEAVWRQFELVAEHCARTKNNKVLIDTTRVDGKVSFVERFLLGEKTQVFAFYGIKVAFVDRPERIDPQKFGELVARNRGVDIRIFPDLQAAKEWLFE
jgi:hypothetical protein